MKKIKAFTLSEVLVTMGIIGVVSAMTIPTLMRNYQKTVYVTQLKKVYSEITQAVNNALVDNKATSLGETQYGNDDSQAVENFMRTYFKIANNCGKNMTPCFAEKYKTRDNKNWDEWYTDEYHESRNCATLADGASICIIHCDSDVYCNYDGCERWEGVPKNSMKPGAYTAVIDINGPQGPNVTGRDYFRISIQFDGRVSEGLTTFTRENNAEIANEVCNSYGGPGGCFDKIVNDGWKMEY